MCRRSDMGTSVAPSQNSHSPDAVPDSKGATAKVVKGPLAIERNGKGPAPEEIWEWIKKFVRFENAPLDEVRSGSN